jgi:hypothetical protein
MSSNNSALKYQFDLMRARVTNNMNARQGNDAYCNSNNMVYLNNHINNTTPINARINQLAQMSIVNASDLDNAHSFALSKALELKNKSVSLQQQADDILHNAEMMQARQAIIEHANMSKSLALAKLLETEAKNHDIMASLQHILDNNLNFSTNSHSHSGNNTDSCEFLPKNRFRGNNHGDNGNDGDCENDVGADQNLEENASSSSSSSDKRGRAARRYTVRRHKHRSSDTATSSFN